MGRAKKEKDMVKEKNGAESTEAEGIALIYFLNQVTQFRLGFVF
ncbi:MAG: hypothetical protein ABSE95_11595 [Thermodesulfobacteriota bacterium]|jgi:hypothetical protein